jgi:murein hydrolase activator
MKAHWITAVVLSSLAVTALGCDAPTLIEAERPLPGGAPTLDLDVDLRSADHESKSLNEELAKIDNTLKEVELRSTARGRVYFKHVRAGLLPAGGGFDELVDHAARLERLRLALVRDLAKTNDLKKRRGAIDERLTKLSSDRAVLEAHKATIQRAEAALRQADERRDAFDRAFESSGTTPDYVAIYGADNGPIDDGGKSFGSLYGRLPFPISGRAEVTRIDRTGAGGPGLELKAPKGAKARAVAIGRVAFASPYQGEFVTVILDHGDRFFTIYQNLESAEVRVGETIPTNTALGKVAFRPGEGAILYFELRKGGEAKDPSPWLGL